MLGGGPPGGLEGIVSILICQERRERGPGRNQRRDVQGAEESPLVREPGACCVWAGEWTTVLAELLVCARCLRQLGLTPAKLRGFILQVRSLKLGEVKFCAQGHSKWQMQASDPPFWGLKPGS